MADTLETIERSLDVLESFIRNSERVVSFTGEKREVYAPQSEALPPSLVAVIFGVSSLFFVGLVLASMNNNNGKSASTNNDNQKSGRAKLAMAGPIQTALSV